jgi:hypothetical protein
MKNTLDLKAFVASYLATAAWVTCDSSDECTDFTEEAKAMAKRDCTIFITKVIFAMGFEVGGEMLTIPGDDLTYLAPHDFWLTRNGHGAGFWDKEDKYGEENAKVLTEIAQSMGVVDCYHIEDDVTSNLTF